MNSRRAKADGKKNAASGFYMVLARGFPWKVTKQNIIDLFKGIKILNGEKGINIMKDGAMVAYVQLTSNADVKKALALDNKRVDSRTIHGKLNEIQEKYHVSSWNLSQIFIFFKQLHRSILRNTRVLHLKFRRRMIAVWCK